MKKIECFIRPEKLEELKNALRLGGVSGITISDVRGFGAQTTRPENYLVLPKVKIEIFCTDAQLKELTEIIIRVCKENGIGSGKIAILPVEEMIRVRTGERGDKAIS